MNQFHSKLPKIALLGWIVILLGFAPKITSGQVVHWGNSFVPAWGDGDLTGFAPNVAPGVSCTVNIVNSEPNSWTNITGSVPAPSVSPNNSRGGFFYMPGVGGLLELDVDWASRNSYLTVEYVFSQPVYDLSFYVGDIDKFNSNARDYVDRVTFNAYNGITPVLTNPSYQVNTAGWLITSGNQVYANTAAGQGGNAGTTNNGNQQGTVRVSYSVPLTRLVIRYDNSALANSNPALQAIAIGNMNFTMPIISGTVWHDANNSANNTFSNIQNGSEAGTNAGGQLYVNLVNSLGIVFSSVAVASNGTYSIAAPESTIGLRLQLSDIQGVAGSAMPASEMPTNWDATSPMLTSTFSTTDANITGRDFGVNQAPETATITNGTVGNPGAYNFYTIPASSFQGGAAGTRDYSTGTVTQMRITSFPTNTNYIRIDGVIYRNGGSCAPATSCTNWPSGGVTVPFTNGVGVAVPIAIDPVEGAVTAVISIAAIDNGGLEDPTPGAVSQPFSVITATGFLFNDFNGNGLRTTNEPRISGTSGTNSGSVTTGTALYAILADINGYVIEVEQLQANGNFTFDQVPPSTNGLSIRISTAIGTVGSNKPAITLPAGWVITGESNNGVVDATSDGELIYNSGTATASNLTIGWERPPVAQALNFTISSPPVNTFLTLNGTGSQPGPLAGTDAEDGTMGSGKTVVITSLPSNNNQVWYNGVRITNGANGTSAPSTTNPFVIANYNPALLQVRATGLGSTGIQFGYSFIDNAGVQGTPQNYSINWAFILPVHITSFTARAENESSVLNWKVDNQEKFDRYEVEYASEIGKFALVGTVKASTAFADNYQFTHHNASSKGNKAYYRLKLIDIDGQYSYSETVLVKFTNDGASIFPTILRAGETLYVQAGAGNNQSLQLIDNNGRIVSQQRMNGQSVNNVNTSQLRSGVYIVRLQTGTTQVVQRIVVQP